MAKEYCPSCGEEMDYIGGGEWECPECGDELYTGYDEDGESTEECISLDEAAQIWASHGCDEDYTFGYPERRLEEALR